MATWNSSHGGITSGIFLCLDCSATHRSMGVHTTFVRSVDLDEWTQRQIDAMRLGGNQNATTYFRKHGLTDLHGKIEKKYKSKAAQLYKVELSKLVEQATVQRGEGTATEEAAESILDRLSLADQDDQHALARQKLAEAAQPPQVAQPKATLAAHNPNAKGKLTTPPSSGNAPRVVLRKPSAGSINLLKKKPSTTSRLRVNKLSTDDGMAFEDIEATQKAAAAPPPKPPAPTVVAPPPAPSPVVPVQPPPIKPPAPTIAKKTSMEESMAKLKNMNNDFFAGM